MDQMGRIGSILMCLVLLAVSCSPVIQDDFSVPQGEVVIKLEQDHQTTATKTAEALPEVGEFIVEVTETSSGRLFYKKKYSDAMDQTLLLNQGEHRLFAYYGDPKGIGFNSCYYVADQLFDVKPNSVNNIDAVARLANVKVAVNFGQGLAYDYSEYYAEVVAANRGKLVFTKKETRHGYAPAGDLSLVLYVYVQDKWMCYKTEPVTCQGNDFITFNVDTERYGELAGIQVVVSNETEEVVKDIKVPGEAAPQDAPSLSVSGFSNNRFSTVEADPAKHSGLKADIVAMGGIGSCVLDLTSSYLSSQGIPSSIDLVCADESVISALETVGIRFMRDMGGKRLSYVDFSGFANYVAHNVAYHPDYEQSLADFKLTVTDKVGKAAFSDVYTIAIDKSQADVVFSDYDVWATKLTGATLTVTKGDPSKYVLKCVKASDMMYTSVQTIQPQSVNGNKVKFSNISGLASGTGYKVWAVYNDNAYNNTSDKSFTTENAQQVGNNSFEQHTYETFDFSINWTTSKGSRVWYQLYASGESDPWWAVNSTATLDKEFWAGYWYYKCFPTVCVTNENPYIGSRSVVVASIAIDDSASEVKSGDAIQGELYIGKADNSGERKNSHISDGHSFGSRPTSMSFYYKFDCHDSPFAAEIVLYDAAGEEIASGKYTSGTSDVSSWTRAEVPLDYIFTNRKVSKIYIRFVSSSTGSTESRKIKLNVLNSNGSTYTTEDLHAGNVVWLDYVTLHY